MALTGAGFLDVSRATSFVVSRHALDRINEHTDLRPTTSLATVLFKHGRQVKPLEMFLLGYRPGYVRRLREGKKSWYFRFVVYGEPMVAVVTEGTAAGEFVWVTTYHPNSQSERYRLDTAETLVA